MKPQFTLSRSFIMLALGATLLLGACNQSGGANSVAQGSNGFETLSANAAPQGATNAQEEKVGAGEDLTVSLITDADSPSNDLTSAFYDQQLQKLIAQREELLAAQLEARKQALVDLDTKAQTQIAEIQRQIDALTAEAAQKQSELQALQQEITQIQELMQQDDRAFQNEITQWQTNDARLVEELNLATAQLETAYAKLAAQRQAQTTAMSAQSGPPLNSSKTSYRGGDYDADHDSNNYEDRHYEDDDRKEYYDDDYDDDYDDHDDHDD